MNLIKQPRNSRLCGQCCVAMLSNHPLEDVIGQIRDTVTTWREIRSALFQFGVIAEEKMQPAFRASDIPPTAVLMVPTGSSLMKHAVVAHGGTVYDPAHGTYPVEHLMFASTPSHEVIRFAKVTHR